MPFTAVHADRGLLDTTILAPDVWAEVYRRSAPLACPECHLRMKACRSVLGTAYFAHYRRLDCAHGEGETETHRAIKRAVLAAVRAADGWTAEPEVTGEGTRADVLATGPGGRRIAFEVQVSSIGGVTAAERSRRHTAADTEVVWLPTTTRHALSDLPRARIELREDEWVVAEHALEFIGEAPPLHAEGPFRRREYGVCAVYSYLAVVEYDGKWRVATPPLAAFVGGVCRGSVRWVNLDGRAAWTTWKHVEQWQEAKQRLAEQIERDRQEAEQRHAERLERRMKEPRLVYPSGTINGRPRAPFTPAAGRTPVRDWEREATAQAQALCKQRWCPSGGPTPW